MEIILLLMYCFYFVCNMFLFRVSRRRGKEIWIFLRRVGGEKILRIYNYIIKKVLFRVFREVGRVVI